MLVFIVLLQASLYFVFSFLYTYIFVKTIRGKIPSLHEFVSTHTSEKHTTNRTV